MRIKIKETRHTRNFSVDLNDVKDTEEEFVGLVDFQHSPTQLKSVVEDAFKGFKCGVSPELCEEGVGGTYFIKDKEGKKIAVFKPLDEEAHSINNPKGFKPRRNSLYGMKEGIMVGEASLRECAAFLLDHDHFAGVPATDLALCQSRAFYSASKTEKEEVEDDLEFDDLFSPKPSPNAKVKLGSLQQFIQHDGDCEDIGRNLLAKFPVDEVHKIAQLDCRILNADRHGGNILYKKVRNDKGEETYELIPIDHGYALPSRYDECWFEWLYWPQAKEKMSPTTLKYIESLDVDQDIQILKDKFRNTIREEHIIALKISTLLLKECAKAGMTFFQIGSWMCRPDHHTPCVLEEIYNAALARSKLVSSNGIQGDAFFTEIKKIIEERIALLPKLGDSQK